MYPAARRVLPAVLMAIAMVLQGCGEDQDSPLGPSAEPAAVDGDADLKAEKARNAVDLGRPTMLLSSLGTSSVTLFGATAGSIPFDPEPGPFANRVELYDDYVSEGLPIGFSFIFFGNRYTSFNLSSNGFIGFSPMDHGCCTGEPIPSNDGLNNIIAAAWTDLDPPRGRGVFYETRGRSPNRYLVVDYRAIPWCCDYSPAVTTQIILYEGSNAIEIHTARQIAGHIYTQGVEDATGTQAVFLPGRVAANYGLTNDAVRFTTTLGSWTGRAPLPSARRGPAVAVAGGLLYSIAGGVGTDGALTSVLAYNPSSNSWSTRASLPAARHRGNGAVTIGSTIYVPGGFDAAGRLTRTLYAYNTTTRTWSTRANMLLPSACGASAAISGKLYVFTGCTLSNGVQTAARSLHRDDPATNRWTALRSAPAVHVNPAMGAIGGKLYVVGGNDAASVQINRLDVYDPATNSWIQRAGMPTPRDNAAAAVVGGKLHVIGGRNGQTYLKTVEAYDPSTGVWTVRASMPTARAAAGVGVINNLVYAVGGRRSSTSLVATNERYTP
jgi:N-acetylneuraminic acid mutarotase